MINLEEIDKAEFLHLLASHTYLFSLANLDTNTAIRINGKTKMYFPTQERVS